MAGIEKPQFESLFLNVLLLVFVIAVVVLLAMMVFLVAVRCCESGGTVYLPSSSGQAFGVPQPALQGEVNGFVLEKATGQPNVGVYVWHPDSSGTIISHALTDDAGFFTMTFDRLYPDEYLIEAAVATQPQLVTCAPEEVVCQETVTFNY